MAEDNGSSSNAKKGGKIFLIVGVLVIIALLAVIAYLVFGRGGQSEEAQPTQATEARRDVLINEDNIDDIAEAVEQSTPPGFYEVVMNSTWNFPDGSAESTNAYVENADTNTNAVYFDVIRSDTNETIYASPVLPVGTHLEHIKLDEVLPAGTYGCTLIYHLIDDNQKTISTVNMGLTIVIEQ